MSRFACIIALLLLVAGPAGAKINLQDSAEWLCAKSEIVAFGQLVEVWPVENPAGKNRDLISLKLKLTGYNKGGPAKPDPKALGSIYFSVRLKSAIQLEKWKADKTELVVFLRRTIQAYSGPEGANYDLWPARETKSGVQMLLDPKNPEVPLLSAGEMKRARTQAQVTAACQRAQKEVIDPKIRPGEPRQPHMLETPHPSEAFNVLYSGSACFLYVPPGVFPKAKKDF